MPHWGIEQASAVCRSDALATELHPHQVAACYTDLINLQLPHGPEETHGSLMSSETCQRCTHLAVDAFRGPSIQKFPMAIPGHALATIEQKSKRETKTKKTNKRNPVINCFIFSRYARAWRQLTPPFSARWCVLARVQVSAFFAKSEPVAITTRNQSESFECFSQV